MCSQGYSQIISTTKNPTSSPPYKGPKTFTGNVHRPFSCWYFSTFIAKLHFQIQKPPAYGRIGRKKILQGISSCTVPLTTLPSDTLYVQLCNNHGSPTQKTTAGCTYYVSHNAQQVVRQSVPKVNQFVYSRELAGVGGYHLAPHCLYKDPMLSCNLGSSQE